MPRAAHDLPRSSVIDRQWADAAWFKDCHRAKLRRPEASVIDIFEAVFGHHPGWMKRALVIRNALAARTGLAVPPEAAVSRFTRRAEYRVGDDIGPWPIFALTENELVAGRDNAHLDFRLSILKYETGAGTEVAVSTLCQVRNAAGKLYLLAVIPFHRRGVPWLIRRAITARRL